MKKGDFKDVAFSRVVNLAGKIIKNYEHDTELFNAFMYDYLCLIESKIAEMKKECLNDSSSTFPKKEKEHNKNLNQSAKKLKFYCKNPRCITHYIANHKLKDSKAD